MSPDRGVRSVRRHGRRDPVEAEVALMDDRAGLEVNERPACAGTEPES